VVRSGHERDQSNRHETNCHPSFRASRTLDCHPRGTGPRRNSVAARLTKWRKWKDPPFHSVRVTRPQACRGQAEDVSQAQACRGQAEDVSQAQAANLGTAL